MKTKRILSVLVSLLLFATFPAVEAGAETSAGAGQCKITAGSANTIPGREITVPVTVEGNPGFHNLAVALEYDRSKLELKSIQTGEGKKQYLCGTVENRTNIRWKTGENGTAGFLVAASPRSVTGDGILFTATFLTKADFTDTSAVQPKVLYMRSNAEGKTEFRSVSVREEPGTVSAILAGDVNGDGVVEYDDVMAAYRVSQTEEKKFPEADRMLVADLVTDGVIDGKDVTAIYTIYTGGN